MTISVADNKKVNDEPVMHETGRCRLNSVKGLMSMNGLGKFKTVIMCFVILLCTWKSCFSEDVSFPNFTISCEEGYYFYDMGMVVSQSGSRLRLIFVMQPTLSSADSVRVKMEVSGNGFSFDRDKQCSSKSFRVDSVGAVVSVFDNSFEFLENVKIQFVKYHVSICPAANGQSLDVGINLFTGAGRTQRSAIVKVVGHSGNVDDFTCRWELLGGKCQFVRRDDHEVTYENKYLDNINGPSRSFKDQKLVAHVTIHPTTQPITIKVVESFSVIMVDAEVTGVSESAEETGEAVVGASNVELSKMSAYAAAHQTCVSVTSKPDITGAYKAQCNGVAATKSNTPGKYIVTAVDSSDGLGTGTFVVEHPASGAKDKICFSEVRIDSSALANYPVDKKRSRFGVGERVDLSIVPSRKAIWSSTTGVLKYDEITDKNRLQLDGNSETVIVEASIGGSLVLVKEFEVVEPTSMGTASFLRDVYIPPEDVGVWFWVRVPVAPDDVSFENVQFKEVGMDATSLTGVYSGKGPTVPSHIGNGADVWFDLSADNTWDDEQRMYPDANSYTISNGRRDRNAYPYVGSGAYNWVVPMKWRLVDAPDAEHDLFIDQLQEFFLSEGTATIRKFGHSRSRSPQLK